VTFEELFLQDQIPISYSSN